MTSATSRHAATPLILALAASAVVVGIALAQPARPPTSYTTDPSADGSELPLDSMGLPLVPESRRTRVDNSRVFNREATIPPQCYTKTEGHFNPCFTCHQSYGAKQTQRLNQASDGDLQGSYAFSDVGLTNHYKNLFVDRTDWLTLISDEAMLRWVNRENYSALRERLADRNFEGFTPDLIDYERGAEAFDHRGLAVDGSAWVAFNYMPFPGTFWPTNGSADDVLLRLPPEFRTHEGAFSAEVYFVNLSLIELNVKDAQEVSIWPTSEHSLGVDLDGNGHLSQTTKLRPRTHFVGDASHIPIAFQQFPAGTELMHSVRYLSLNQAEEVVPAARMKELRYMKKLSVLSRPVINDRYAHERREKRLGELPRILRRGDAGLDNGLGWLIKGFIEDEQGELRPQSYEEDLYCVGCHKGIGTTIDSTFSFARKVPGREGWGYIDLKKLRDVPSLGESEGELLSYLRRVGGGSEFRENSEMTARWFGADGIVDAAKVTNASIYELVTPSARRALDLNKSYTHIVRHQSFIEGRDATIHPSRNVLQRIDDEVAPLTSEHRQLGWDIRLSWDGDSDSPI